MYFSAKLNYHKLPESLSSYKPSFHESKMSTAPVPKALEENSSAEDVSGDIMKAEGSGDNEGNRSPGKLLTELIEKEKANCSFYVLKPRRSSGKFSSCAPSEEDLRYLTSREFLKTTAESFREEAVIQKAEPIKQFSHDYSKTGWTANYRYTWKASGAAGSAEGETKEAAEEAAIEAIIEGFANRIHDDRIRAQQRELRKIREDIFLNKIMTSDYFCIHPDMSSESDSD